jgi:hypothetical protein
MSNRYFLSTLLPSLSLTEPHQLSLDALEFALEQNLSAKELRAVNQIWLLGDVENVRSFFHDDPMNKKGSLETEDMAAMLTWNEKKPLWLERFLNDFPTEEKRAQHSSDLSRYCLLYAPLEAGSSSIQELLSFDFTTRLVLEFLRGEKNASEEIPFLKTPATEWPSEYSELAVLWEKNKNSPLELEQKMAEWRFQVLDGKRALHSPFSLSYLIFSVSLFEFIESRRPLVENALNKSQERIVKALKQ